MSPTRRIALTAALGALAAAAGGGLAWRRHVAAAAAVDTDPPVDLWALRLPRPEGGQLALADFRDRPLLINFWATWCAPCVRELPEIDRFAAEAATRGVRSVALALDGLAPVKQFLQQHPVAMPVALAGVDGSDLVRQLGNPQGGLPFTVLLAADGQVLQRKLGETSHAELSAWVAALPRG